MLSDNVSILIGGPFISFIIITMSAFSGIFLFVNWQVIRLLKTANADFNTVLSPLDVKGLNDELEPFGFAYDLEEDFFYSIMYPWQREFGYNIYYDEASPLLSMIIDCEPIYFKYNNRNWLIEFWKGQYGMTTGGEIGFYVSNEIDKTIENFNNEIIYSSVTDEDCIPMYYTLKKKNKVQINRSARHWWLTGFKLGEFSKPSQLVMDIEMTFKNEAMRNAFTIGLIQAGYKEKNLRIADNTVSLTFNKPHTKQPFIKNRLIIFVMQNYNKLNCKLYNHITKEYKNSLDKINFIRSKFPVMYELLLNFMKTEQLFKNYKPTMNLK